MSGTPRPGLCGVFAEGGTFAPACQDGTGKIELTPPPPAPMESFQTTSRVIFPSADSNRVPPQPRTNGLDAGKSACARPSRLWSRDPSSPDAQQTVITTAA